MNILCDLASDDFRSDCYVYADADGWHIHVQAARYASDAPRIPARASIPQEGPLREPALSAYVAAIVAQRAWLLETPMVPIGLPNDGDSFHALTTMSALCRLIELLRAGYRVPSFVFVHLRGEIAQQRKKARTEIREAA